MEGNVTESCAAHFLEILDPPLKRP